MRHLRGSRSVRAVLVVRPRRARGPSTRLGAAMWSRFSSRASTPSSGARDRPLAYAYPAARESRACKLALPSFREQPNGARRSARRRRIAVSEDAEQIYHPWKLCVVAALRARECGHPVSALSLRGVQSPITLASSWLCRRKAVASPARWLVNGSPRKLRPRRWAAVAGGGAIRDRLTVSLLIGRSRSRAAVRGEARRARLPSSHPGTWLFFRVTDPLPRGWRLRALRGDDPIVILRCRRSGARPHPRSERAPSHSSSRRLRCPYCGGRARPSCSPSATCGSLAALPSPMCIRNAHSPGASEAAGAGASGNARPVLLHRTTSTGTTSPYAGELGLSVEA